jgi:hypothetical protein
MQRVRLRRTHPKWLSGLYGSEALREHKADVFALVSALLVGATGFEPVTPSVSANHREPLCGRPFPQVTLDRKGRSSVLS